MIIPVRCFTCNKVLADKWDYYKKKEEEIEAQAKDKPKTHGGMLYPGETGKVLDELGLTRICCRRHMKAHIELMEII